MPKTIFIVDDEEDLLFLTKSILEKRGYKVLNTNTGARAFELIEQSLPDLVILDQLLPDANGLEICHRLKTNAKTSTIPVLITSGQIAAHPSKEIPLLPPDESLLKPFEIDDFLKKIEKLLQSPQA